MRAMQVKMDEDGLRCLVLDALQGAAERVIRGGRVDEDHFRDFLEFIDGFIHRVHIARDAVLLGREGRRRGQTLSDLKRFSSAILRALPRAARGDANCRRLLAENAIAYAGLARRHIEERGKSTGEREERRPAPELRNRALGPDERGPERFARLAGRIIAAMPPSWLCLREMSGRRCELASTRPV